MEYFMKLKPKFLLIFFLCLIFWESFCMAYEPEIASTAAILVEESTQKILYEKNAYEKMYPASTTKILTAILTLENCKLDEMATVSRNAVYSLPAGYVNANLQPGEEMTVKDLLYALMVKSANDAAIVLAEHVGGSVENFAEMMNATARELGCQNTHFVNPNGIHQENHYTTAYDLYLMASYCMKNETFQKYVSTTSYTLPATNQYPATDRICTTTNDMLRPKSQYYNENVIGIKTGYTTEAKNCLIAGARKNNIELISVVLQGGTNSDGLSERYVDTNALFDYGFDDFAVTDFVKENDVIQNIEIENANNDTKSLDLLAKDTLSAYLNTEFDVANLEPEITLNENLEAPIAINSVLGKVTYTIDGTQYTTELLASHNVEKKIDTQIILFTAGVLLLAVGITFLFTQHRHKKKKSKKKKTRK